MGHSVEPTKVRWFGAHTVTYTLALKRVCSVRLVRDLNAVPGIVSPDKFSGLIMVGTTKPVGVPKHLNSLSLRVVGDPATSRHLGL